MCKQVLPVDRAIWGVKLFMRPVFTALWAPPQCDGMKFSQSREGHLSTGGLAGFPLDVGTLVFLS